MSGALACAEYLIILTTKLVEKYQIHKNITMLNEVLDKEKVGNDFQLQDINLQKVEAKVHIEDDLVLESIEESLPDQRNTIVEQSGAKNEPLLQGKLQTSQTEETRHTNFTVEAEIHPSLSGNRNIEFQTATEKVQNLCEPRSKIIETNTEVKNVRELHEDLDGIEILSEEIIEVQDRTPQPYMLSPDIKINNQSFNPELNTITVGLISFLIGVLVNVPLWILYFNVHTFSDLFIFVQLNFVPLSFGTFLLPLIQFIFNERMRKFVLEMYTDMYV